MHVGHKSNEFKCQEMSVDKWRKKEVTNDETGGNQFKDVALGKRPRFKVSEYGSSVKGRHYMNMKQGTFKNTIKQDIKVKALKTWKKINFHIQK